MSIREQAAPVPVDTLKRNTARLSLLSNTFLVLGKLAVGWFTGSISVLAEAVHSSIDLTAAIIAYVAVRTASRPPDREHRFGHGKIENISGLAEALLIFVASLLIVRESILKFLHGGAVQDVHLGLAIMAVSSAVNLYVSNRLFHVGKMTDSVALRADGMHLLTDVYTSAGVAVGLLLLWATGIHWLDPLVALLVAVMITHAAWELTREAFGDLMDRSLPEAEEKAIRNLVRQYYPHILELHALRTRKSGPKRYIDMHVVFRCGTTLEQAHAISEVLEKQIAERLPNADVVLHLEPCDQKCRACPVGNRDGGGSPAPAQPLAPAPDGRRPSEGGAGGL